jgi:hypothetical protein
VVSDDDKGNYSVGVSNNEEDSATVLGVSPSRVEAVYPGLRHARVRGTPDIRGSRVNLGPRGYTRGPGCTCEPTRDPGYTRVPGIYPGTPGHTWGPWVFHVHEPHPGNFRILGPRVEGDWGRGVLERGRDGVFCLGPPID